jgi:hypothetical protein
MIKGMDEDLKTYLEAKFGELRADVRTDIEKSETNLLRAFHGWSRSTEIRPKR